MAKFLRLVNGLPTSYDEAGSTPYDESIYYASGLAANTAITIPNSGSFTDSLAKDLIIIVNDLIRENTVDYEVVGAGPTFTQVRFIYDLPLHSRVRFKKNI